MGGLTLSKTTDAEQWDQLVQQSPQGTIFCLSKFLNLFKAPVEYCFINRSGYPVIGVPIIDASYYGSTLLPHTYFQGPMFSAEAYNCKPYRQSEHVVTFAEEMMDLLSAEYDQLAFSLHPDIQDIRGFDWFNYHNPDGNRAQIFPRYTAIVNLQAGDSFDDVLADMRSARRQEHGYATKRHNLSFTQDGTPEELLALMEETFARQDKTLAPKELEIVEQLAKQIPALGMGHLYSVRKPDGKAVALGLSLDDIGPTTHLPIVATGSDRYGGTLLYVGMLEDAYKRGQTHFDFNGANSPQRGFFKHSCAGQAKLFFEVVWSK